MSAVSAPSKALIYGIELNIDLCYLSIYHTHCPRHCNIATHCVLPSVCDVERRQNNDWHTQGPFSSRRGQKGPPYTLHVPHCTGTIYTSFYQVFTLCIKSRWSHVFLVDFDTILMRLIIFAFTFFRRKRFSSDWGTSSIWKVYFLQNMSEPDPCTHVSMAFRLQNCAHTPSLPP